MPAKKQTGGVNVAEVDRLLPRSYFVTRGDIQSAFGFTKQDTRELVDSGIFAAKCPFPKKAGAKGEPKKRFVREQVLHVAREWGMAK